MENTEAPNLTMDVNSVDNSSPPENVASSAAQAVDEATQQVENKQQAKTPDEPAALTLGLLKQVKNFMDVVIQRGVVKPEEMSTVGNMYDQYVAGLNNLIPKAN